MRIKSDTGKTELAIFDDNIVHYRIEPDGSRTPIWDSAGHLSRSKVYPPLPDPPPAAYAPADARPVGIGVSHYGAPSNLDIDLRAWLRLLADLGVRHTRIGWMMDAWANGNNQPSLGASIPGGMYAGAKPWRQLSDGRFDLAEFDPVYWDRVVEFAEIAREVGIHVVWTLFDLYSWSNQKAKLWGVPTPNLQPQRCNINGVRWGVPDDDIGFWTQPLDWVQRDFIGKTVAVLTPFRTVCSIEIGNEWKQKEHHGLVRDELRKRGWTGDVQVNRNEDTPSQYHNMGIGLPISPMNPAEGGYDRIAFHGCESLAYLDHDHGSSQHRFRTFRAAWDSGQIAPNRVVISTDGVGFSHPPYYDIAALMEVVRDAKARGFAVEHQAREMKHGIFDGVGWNLNRLDTNLIAAMVSA